MTFNALRKKVVNDIQKKCTFYFSRIVYLCEHNSLDTDMSQSTKQNSKYENIITTAINGIMKSHLHNELAN